MNEEVTDDEGKALAKDINAIYLRASAKLNSSIDEIFINIGKRFINPDCEISTNLTKEEKLQKIKKLKKETIKNNNKRKKKFC